MRRRGAGCTAKAEGRASASAVSTYIGFYFFLIFGPSFRTKLTLNIISSFSYRTYLVLSC